MMILIFATLSLCFLTSAGVPHKRDSKLSVRSYPTTPHTLELTRKHHHRHARLGRRDDPIIDASQTKFLTTITVNGDDFIMEIDTGSSDTWLVADNFVCEATPGGKAVAESMCNFGATLNIDNGFSPVDNAHFDTCYGSKPYRCVTGPSGTTEVEIAGVTIPEQIVGAITLSSGFVARGSVNEMSGLMGLGYPGLTGQYNGSVPDVPFLEPCENVVPYSPIIETLFYDPTVSPALPSKSFSLAISRDKSNNSYGGVLALGGLPDGAFTDPRINATDDVAVTSTKNNTLCTGDVLGYYSMVVDGFLVDGTTYNPNQQVIVDSGATFINAPAKTADAFNAGWSGTPIDQYGSVDCDAVPLPFCLVVAGVSLCINPRDLKYLDPNGYCYSTIISTTDPLDMLMGDTFLKNVIAVFEWDPDTIGFYSRMYYTS